MVSRFEYVLKGVLLTLLGVILLFFPGIIKMLFYIIGAIIIIACVGSILTSGSDGVMLGPGIVGIGIGILVFMLPKIIATTISIVVCVIFCIYGISRIAKALITDNKSSRIVHLVVGAVLIGAGIFLGCHPFSAGNLTRIVVGIVVLFLAMFNFLIVHMINQRRHSSGSGSNVVDVNDYTVHDDNKYLK